MQLDDKQKKIVTSWIEEGLDLSEIQGRIESEFNISMTYMEGKKSIQKVYRGKNAIEISESLPIVSLCIKEKDKSCFGVISNVEDEETRTDGGNFTSAYTKELGDTLVVIVNNNY